MGLGWGEGRSWQGCNDILQNTTGAWGCSLGGGRDPGCWAGGDLGSLNRRAFFLFLARNCMRLQVLELDHVSEITQEVAAEVCREGLKGLEMLVLTATPVTPKALLHFNSEQWGNAGQGMAITCHHGLSVGSISNSLML